MQQIQMASSALLFLFVLSCWPHTIGVSIVPAAFGEFHIGDRPLRGGKDMRSRAHGVDGKQPAPGTSLDTKQSCRSSGGYATRVYRERVASSPYRKTLLLLMRAPWRAACKFSSVWQSDFRGRALKGSRRHDNFTPRHLRELRKISAR
jgi:hypothetical protein